MDDTDDQLMEVDGTPQEFETIVDHQEKENHKEEADVEEVGNGGDKEGKGEGDLDEDEDHKKKERRKRDEEEQEQNSKDANQKEKNGDRSQSNNSNLTNTVPSTKKRGDVGAPITLGRPALGNALIKKGAFLESSSI